MNRVNPKVSICIPVYEMNGRGVEFLDFCMSTIYKQTYKNVEVVISDHSVNKDIEHLCLNWSEALSVKYIRNEFNRGNSSANINKAIQNATGDMIKILFQDDFLYNEHSLHQQINQLIEDNTYWLVAACSVFVDEQNQRPFFPVYNDNIQYGNNTMGPPSILLFWNADVILFDENLIWLMDVDYYKRLYDKHGLPSLGRIETISNREHSNQVSNTMVTAELRNREMNHVINKYERINNTSEQI